MSRKGENINKRKDGRWEGRYKKSVANNGKVIYGYCYGKTYRETKDKLEERKRQLYNGQDYNRQNTKKLFHSYCDDWFLANRYQLKESTIVKYAAIIENHIKPFFGDYLPKYITTESVNEFTVQLVDEKKLSAKTVRDILALLKTIIKYVSKYHIEMSFVEISVPKYNTKEICVLSGDEQAAFIRYLMNNTDEFKFGILSALMTGLRIGEVCALRSGDISLTEKTVTVRETVQRIKNLDGDGPKTKIIFTKPKSDTSARVVPLTNTAFELCKTRVMQAEPDSFLLTGTSHFIEPRILQNRIKKYSRECGIKDIHFHVLRHTFATRCVEVGFEIKSLSEVLGHSSPRITLEKYVHSSIEFKRQNMIKLEAIGL